MKCVICEGIGVLIRDQLEVCDNCGGSGEIITEDMVNGNDCKGNCS